MKLVVEVDAARDYLGRLTGVASRGPLFGPVDACASVRGKSARAAGNGERDPLRPGGNVPFGTYRLGGLRDIPSEHHREYGPKALVFVPTGGEALHAESYGRLDLLLHAGEPGQDGRLRRTGGDLRIDDATLAHIVRAASAGAEITLEVVEWPLGLWERLAGKRLKPSEPRRGSRNDDDDDDDWDSDHDDFGSDRWSSSSSDSASASAPWRGAANVPAVAVAVGAAAAAGAVAAATSAETPEIAEPPESPDIQGPVGTEMTTSY